MASHSLFAALVVLVLLVLLTTGLVYLRRVPRLGSATDVEALLRRLIEVDRHKLAQVSSDLHSPEEHTELDAWQLWELTGGIQGLEALAANCEVLIDLACYVQRWYPEALPVAEQLRLNAREVQWHLSRLEGAKRRGHLQSAFPDYAQRAVAIYYGMTQNLLALFEVSQVPGYAQVRATF